MSYIQIHIDVKIQCTLFAPMIDILAVDITSTPTPSRLAASHRVLHQTFSNTSQHETTHERHRRATCLGRLPYNSQRSRARY